MGQALDPPACCSQQPLYFGPALLTDQKVPPHHCYYLILRPYPLCKHHQTLGIIHAHMQPRRLGSVNQPQANPLAYQFRNLIQGIRVFWSPAASSGALQQLLQGLNLASVVWDDV